MKQHPEAAILALHAGGELPLARRIPVALHVRLCGQCRREVAAFRQATLALQQQARALPPGVDWAALEAEMKANIRLGVTAGAIVRDGAVRPARWRPQWKPAVVVAATIAVVVAAGWLLERNEAPRPEAIAGSGVVLQSTPDGLAVEWGRGESAVLGAGRPPVAAAVSWDGSVRAPFLDEETGQVTIYNVAAQ
jgi:hypothetical protein